MIEWGATSILLLEGKDYKGRKPSFRLVARSADPTTFVLPNAVTAIAVDQSAASSVFSGRATAGPPLFQVDIRNLI